MDYYKNKLMRKLLSEYYNTFACTLDTADYVPSKFNNKIYSYIFKNMKKQFKQVDKEAKIHSKEVATKNKLKQPKKVSFISRLFSKLKQRHDIVKEEADYCCSATIDECANTSALDNNVSEYANE